MAYTEIVIIFFVVTQLLDIWTTNKALKLPNLREGNPLMRFFQDRFGKFWAVPRFGLGVILAYGLWYWTQSFIPIITVSVVILLVALNNYRLYQKYK